MSNEPELNKWVVVIMTPPAGPDLHMISVDVQHTSDEVAQGFALMNKEKLSKESKLYVFAADSFLEMLRERGDPESMKLALSVIKTFENESVIMTPHNVNMVTPNIEQVHNDQGIPKNGQETG